MPPLTRKELDDYKTYAKRASADLAVAIADRRFQEAGGTIRYAVDFSEIHAFLIHQAPDKDWMWPGLDANSASIVEHCALSEVLLGQERPVLLPPYALEFERFIAELRDRMRRSIIRAMADALATVEAVRGDPRVQEALELARQVSAHSRTLTDGELQTVVGVCEAHGKNLVQIVRRDVPNPLMRTKALLQRRPFVSPAAEDLPAIAENDQVVGHRYAELRALRGRRADGASYIDALAIEYIRLANKRAVESGRRDKYLLVTRSPHVAELVAREIDEGLWPEDSGNIVRHPRVYAPLAWDATGRDDFSGLEATMASLDLFWRSAELRLMGMWDELRPSNSGDKRLVRTVSSLKHHIVRLVEMGAALNEAYLVPAGNTARPGSIEEVLELMTILRSDDAVFNAVAARMAEISEQVDYEHELLGVALHSHDPAAQERIRKDLSVMSRGTRGTSLVPSFGHVAYTLRFTSSSVAEWASSIHRGYVVEEDLWRFLMQPAEGHRDHYEMLLLMAYVLAVLGNFDLAVHYSERALMIAKHHDRDDSDEALFFLSYCRRAASRTAVDVKTGLEFLERARRSARARLQDSGYDDPRFVAEEGIAKLVWHVRGAELQTAAWSGAPTLADAIATLERALTFDPHPKLAVTIFNNLCYARCRAYEQSRSSADHDALRQALETFQERLQALEPDVQRWPVRFADTIAWGHFVLFQAAGERASMIKWIKVIEAGIPQQSAPDRELLELHLQRIKHAYAIPSPSRH